MSHASMVKAWALLKGKEDAPNYRKATGSQKCGNCKAWDSSKTDDPMTGYCEWYDFMCRATNPCRFCSHVDPPITPFGRGRVAMARALPAFSNSRMNPFADRATLLTPCISASFSYACAAAYDIHGYRDGIAYPNGMIFVVGHFTICTKTHFHDGTSWNNVPGKRFSSGFEFLGPCTSLCPCCEFHHFSPPNTRLMMFPTKKCNALC